MYQPLISPEFIYIDLFCGAGGTTTGIVQAMNEHKQGIAIVAACVNHDPVAIKSHWRNHPEVVHFEEDIRTLDLTELQDLVARYRVLYPNAKVILWASLECTNFSKAKGGMARDADSRTLAEHLPRYVIAINPDYIQIENVVEFMAWGPLDANGKPISRKNGQDWLRWRENICSYGYHDDWTEMNSANFGAYTSRNRLFGCFAKHGLPIIFPQPTHSKKVTQNGMFGSLKPWKPVKDVLDFSDEGKSIFTREKPLSEKTLERIYAGLIKFVAGGEDKFLAKIYAVASNSDGTYSTNNPAHTITTRDAHTLVSAAFLSKQYSGDPKSKNIAVDGPAGTITTIDSQALISFVSTYNSGNAQHRNNSVEQPCKVLTTQNAHALINANFLMASNGGAPLAKVFSIEHPCRVLTTVDNKSIVNASFIHSYYSNGDNNRDINSPAPTIRTKDGAALINVLNTPFIYRDFTSGGNIQSINNPAGSILQYPKLNIVNAQSAFLMPTNFDNKPISLDVPANTITANRKHTYLVNPSWFGSPISSDQPCPVIVARQDKAPLYMVAAEEGNVAIPVFEADSECTRKIKAFMALYNIIDVKMRMLKVSELLKIQGFPDGYILEGSQADQKKFIGNSVVPHVVKAWVEAMYYKTRNYKITDNNKWAAVAA